jgi:UDP-GlcNAc3NAcA epimerase
MKIATIVGARPQFIKSAVVSRAMRDHTNRPALQDLIIHTGQHFDVNMSQIFFDQLDIPVPDYNLGISEARHGRMTGKMLSTVEEVLLREEPDTVLVYGDTNSTLAGALAAAKLDIPIAHVEAGLRSYNRRMPEEINRILVDQLSTVLFCPTQTAVDNLTTEGFPHPLAANSRQLIANVGDVMFDAALFYAARSQERSSILDDTGLSSGRYILATIHRAENTDDPHRLKAIFEGLQEVAKEIPVILPLHPRTRKRLEYFNLLSEASTHVPGSLGLGPGVNFVDPLGYLDMVMLEKNARLVVTDSGGVQKEAYFHAVPCVTLREETEWVELVQAGWNTLCPPFDPDRIQEAIHQALGVRCASQEQLYGDGNAGQKIVDLLTT